MNASKVSTRVLRGGVPHTPRFASYVEGLLSWKATAFVKPITHDAFGRKLTSTEKLVLLILSDYYDDGSRCAWPGIARLATESLLSLRQVLRVLKSLEERRLISTERRPNKSNVYRFKFIPSLERCWYCGIDLDDGNRVQDHQTPKSRGGGGGRNLVLACGTCNTEKGPKTLGEYRLSHFDAGHKFHGEVGDKLSCAENVNVIPVVTSTAEKVSPMSHEPLSEPLVADIQPASRPVIDLALEAIRESQRTRESADAILKRLRA